MHILILSKRNAQAQERLLRSAEVLAEYFELDPVLIGALKPNTKDTEVRALKEREGVADLLDALAIRLGLIKESAPEEDAAVTAVTDQAGDPQPGQSVGDPVTPGQVDPVGEDLPPPVLEDVVPIEGEPEIEEFPVEELPAEEPVEKEPEEKRAKKSATKKPAGKSSKKK